MSLMNSNAKLNMNFGETKLLGSLSAKFQPAIEWVLSMTDGTGADQAQKVCFLEPTIDGASPTTYDLTAMTGAPFASAVNFSAIKAMFIFNTGDTNSLVVGAAASNAWEAWTTVAGSTIVIPPNSFQPFINPLAAGFTVDGTHKNLKVSTNTSTTTAKILVVGEGS